MCQASIDVNFDAGGKISSGLIATTIVSQWTWAATLLQSTSVTTKVHHAYLYILTCVSYILGLYNNPLPTTVANMGRLQL